MNRQAADLQGVTIRCKKVGMPEIETARTHLRMFTPDDLDDLAQIVADPAVMKYMGLNGEPMSREETEIALDSIINHWHRHSIGRWAVVHKADGRLIGYGGLRWFEGVGQQAGIPELVYLIDSAYWGRGLATEIARAALKFGFEERKFERVIAMTRPGNAVSRHILEKKLGMRFSGQQTAFGIEVVRYLITRVQYESDGASSF